MFDGSNYNYDNVNVDWKTILSGVISLILFIFAVIVYFKLNTVQNLVQNSWSNPAAKGKAYNETTGAKNLQALIIWIPIILAIVSLILNAVYAKKQSKQQQYFVQSESEYRDLGF